MQRALKPQDPTQGLTQLPVKQASARGQSWLMTHCGRHAGGAPSVPGSHAHTARPSSLRHVECGPHGDRKQGSGGGSIVPTVKHTL